MAATLIASQRIDADVLAVVLLQFALIHVQHEAGREAQLLHGTIRNELDIHLICVGSKERERERERGDGLGVQLKLQPTLSTHLMFGGNLSPQKRPISLESLCAPSRISM